MEENEAIYSIVVEGKGEIFAEEQIEYHNDPQKKQPYSTYRIQKNPITRILKNGEMAQVEWYRQGKTEWNGKYVKEINYY